MAPAPGPISNTTSSDVNSAASTMRSNISPLVKKCCPNALRRDFPDGGPDDVFGESKTLVVGYGSGSFLDVGQAETMRWVIE
jgi:hypothetical protein